MTLSEKFREPLVPAIALGVGVSLAISSSVVLAQEVGTGPEPGLEVPAEAAPRPGDELRADTPLETGFDLPTEIEAVEIPEEVQGEEMEEVEAKEEQAVEEVVKDANVEEEVKAEESTINEARISPRGAPIQAEDLRSRSGLREDGKLGSDVMTRSEARTFNFTIPAPRGQILDRNGYPLAQTKVAYYAAISFPFLGEKVSDEEILQYAGERIVHVNSLLGTEWDLPFKLVVDHYRNRRWVPLTFSSVLSEVQVDEVNRQLMEGLSLHPVYLRHYPQGEKLSHVIGYMGKRPPRLKGPIVGDEPIWGSGIGVNGLEETYETDLRGTPGRVNVLFEADGSKVKEEVLARPRPGHNVVTSIDLELQNICERILEEKTKRGAIVVMDTRNGDVLAMASYPRFNPNDFIPSISTEKFKELFEDPEKPMFARAFRAAYPPASTFKVAVALGFLDSGFLSPRDMYSCPGSYQIGNIWMGNWNPKGEGHMNVITALTRSCNTWFYQVAMRGGADTMSSMAIRLGLGMKTGVPLNETEGFVPTNRWHLKNLGYAMSDGEEAVMSIGQGRLEATPLQVARMMAAVGDGKRVLKPRLVLQIQDLNNELVRTEPTEIHNTLNVDYHALAAVRRGMYQVVNAGNGTGRRAQHKIGVAGKTGTGQWKVTKDRSKRQNVAWFAGFAPAKYPVLSFAALYEGDPGESVGGGKNAGPLIGEMLEEYLTEENYTRVYDASQEIAEARKDEEEGYAAVPVGGDDSIFRSGGGQEAGLQQDPQAEQPAQPRRLGPPQRREGGGFLRLRRLFGGGRR